MKYPGTNHSSGVLSSPCCSGQRSRIAFSLSVRSLRSNQFFPPSKAWVSTLTAGSGTPISRISYLPSRTIRQKTGRDWAAGLASPDANFRAVRPRWISWASWASWHHREASPLSQFVHQLAEACQNLLSSVVDGVVLRSKPLLSAYCVVCLSTCPPMIA